MAWQLKTMAGCKAYWLDDEQQHACGSRALFFLWSAGEFLFPISSRGSGLLRFQSFSLWVWLEKQRAEAELYFPSNLLAHILSLFPGVVAGYCDFKASLSESGQKNDASLGYFAKQHQYSAINRPRMFIALRNGHG
jgi:hypothetical protein